MRLENSERRLLMSNEYKTTNTPQATGESQAQTETMNRHGKPEDAQVRGDYSQTTPSFKRKAREIACTITNGARAQGSKISKLITILAHYPAALGGAIMGYALGCGQPAITAQNEYVMLAAGVALPDGTTVRVDGVPVVAA